MEVHVPPADMGAGGATGIEMKLLLVHQNFPGQFRDLGPALCDLGHELKAITAVSDQPIQELKLAL